MRKLLLVAGVFCAFLVGYGASSQAYPAGGVHGRGEYNGYFTNVNDFNGTHVLPTDYNGDAIPSTVNSASEFISFIKFTKLDLDGNGSGNAQERTGAAFIIHTMIGTPASQRSRPPTAAQISEWERRVNFSASRGWVNWRTNYSYRINSFYQGPRGGGSPNDDAFYDDTGTSAAIVFRNSAGTVVYAIRILCANPVGTTSLGPIPDDASFNMSGRSTVSDTTVLPGQTINFQHFVRNGGPSATSPMAITPRIYNSVTGALITTGGASTYTAGQERRVNSENFTVPSNAAPNTQYCRHVTWTPDSQAGGSGSSARACATVQYDFSLLPNVTVVINNGATTGTFAEVGDRVDFVYSVRNNGLTVSQTAACNVVGRTYTGYRAVPNPPDTTSDPGYAPPATGCPRTFPSNSNTTLVTETIASVPDNMTNRTICRALSVTPAQPSGGTRAVEACVSIANKPYLRVYGGDVSAGNGFSSGATATTCSGNGGAAIIGWNKEGPGTFAGAGAQFATIALNSIFDFASAQGNNTGAPAGSGLAFSNASASGSTFGGNFGALPCIPDFYARRPATTPFSGNLTASGSGAYSANGPVTISGNINGSNRISLFVNGNVIINGDITYTSGAYPNVSDIPLFQLVATGNIYIANNVTRLDGLYVAQGSGGANGIIYTCTNGSNPYAVTALGSNCGSKLTINGSFIARSVQFMRSAGTLGRSSAGETAASGQGAEVFNYSPTMWLTAPFGQSETTDYDAITSLPPIL